MAILFNKVPINTVMPVLEFPDNFIFNGHVYDKYTLNPIPLKFYNQTYSASLSIFKRLLSAQGNWTTPKQLNCMEIDFYDPDSFYITGWDNAYSIIKVSTKNNSFDKVAHVTLTVYSYETPNYRTEIVDQDANYIYVLVNPSDTGHTSYYIPHVQLFKLRKDTLAIISRTDLHDYSHRARVIFKDEQYIYVQTDTASYTHSLLYRIRKFDATVTEIGRVNNLVAFTGMPSAVVEQTNDYFMYYIPRILTTFDVIFSQIVVNRTTGVMTVTDIPCYKNVSGIDEKLYDNLNYSTEYLHEAIYFTDNGKKYLVMFKSNTNGGAGNTNLTTTFFKVFRLRNDGTAVLIQTEQFPVTCNGYLDFSNGKTLVALNKYWIRSYQWNTVEEKYMLVNQINDSVNLIGSDENNNLWAQYSDNRVEVLSQFAPMNITAQFEYEKYDYTGVAIDTHIKYFARNFEGKNVQCVVQLTLDGPCVFAENDKKVITKTTSRTDILTTPVVVNGNGVLRVGIKLLQG